MLHLPALVCHWANITHHISVRICQFLPLCFMLQSPTDFSLFQSRGEEKPGLAAAPVKNWEDFNTSSLLLVAGEESSAGYWSGGGGTIIFRPHHPVSSSRLIMRTNLYLWLLVCSPPADQVLILSNNIDDCSHRSWRRLQPIILTVVGVEEPFSSIPRDYC